MKWLFASALYITYVSRNRNIYIVHTNSIIIDSMKPLGKRPGLFRKKEFFKYKFNEPAGINARASTERLTANLRSEAVSNKPFKAFLEKIHGQGYKYITFNRKSRVVGTNVAIGRWRIKINELLPKEKVHIM